MFSLRLTVTLKATVNKPQEPVKLLKKGTVRVFLLPPFTSCRRYYLHTGNVIFESILLLKIVHRIICGLEIVTLFSFY